MATTDELRASVADDAWAGRLVDYLELNDNDPSLAGFSTYLAQRSDPVFILSTGHYTGFDFVVDVRGQVVRLTTDPEDLVFQEA